MQDKKKSTGRVKRVRRLPELPDLSTLDAQLDESLRLFGPDDNAGQTKTSVATTDDPDVTVDDTCPWGQSAPEWTGAVDQIVDWNLAEDSFGSRYRFADSNEQRRLNGLMGALRSKGAYRKLIEQSPALRRATRGGRLST